MSEKTIPRYRPKRDASRGYDMWPDPDGAWVKFTDVAADLHELTVIRGYVGERGVTDCSTPLFIRVLNIIERLDAAEAELSRLRSTLPQGQD